MEEFTELNSKILAKNLELTRYKTELDRTMSELIDAREKIKNLHQSWMIDTINNILTVLDDNDSLFATPEAKESMLNSLTKIGKHLSPNGSLQNYKK